MRLFGLVSLGVVCAAQAGADVNDLAMGPRVTICSEYAPDPGTLNSAIGLVTKIYADIGVAALWHFGLRSCPTGGILIHLRDATPEGLRPGALAFTFPFEGTRVEVFYDRVLRTVGAKVTPYLLAYILVHETSHILQAVSRHADKGIMKAKWSSSDYLEMCSGGLHFTPEDVALIHAGLEWRARRFPTSSLTGETQAQ
jgi:hypothetical protein